jgi:hypothetical protein
MGSLENRPIDLMKQPALNSSGDGEEENFSATREAKRSPGEHGCCGSGLGRRRTGSGKALRRQPSVGLFLDPRMEGGKTHRRAQVVAGVRYSYGEIRRPNSRLETALEKNMNTTKEIESC